MMRFEIRAYVEARDEEAVHSIWRETLGEDWPLSRETFRRVTVESGIYQPGDHLVAVVGERIVGFVATQTNDAFGEDWIQGELMLLMVAPSHRRQRIGETLLEKALLHLLQKGVRSIQLGSDGVSYFWPGVPTNAPEAWTFFEICGWSSEERSFDLIRSLKDFETPPGIRERVRAEGIRIETATAEDRDAILEFESRHFPEWRIHYEKPILAGEFRDILLAKEADGTLAGATLILDPNSSCRRGEFNWREIFGEDAGGIGAIGVARERRERGIGIALAARATETLKERGVNASFVGYTWLTEWYGKLGYEIWREYRMSRVDRKGRKIVGYACADEDFRPARSSRDVRWLEVDESDYELVNAYWTVPLTREDWRLLKRDGYRYCGALEEGQVVSVAAVWKNSDDAWEVAAVSTAPEARRKGYSKAVVSFATEYILAHGRTATIHTLVENRAMRRTAESVGFVLVPDEYETPAKRG